MASTVELIRSPNPAARNGRSGEARIPSSTGIHTPMTEELTIEDLPVTGTIPAALDGRYLRIGPNPIGRRSRQAITGSSATAWSTACALEDGKALWYRNRWIRSSR